MSTIAKLKVLHERRNTSGRCATENLAAADRAYPALLAIAEAADRFTANPIQGGSAYLSLASALAKLEEVKL